MAETKQDEAEPAVTNTPDQQQNTNREAEILQQVISLLSTPAPENADAAVLSNENTQLRNALTRISAITREKATSCLTLQKKVDAMNIQVSSLKEVVAITKDMLTIRNKEVQHLREDMESIQNKMDLQRKSHNDMITKLDAAMKLNEQLKTEYQLQLKLFQSLKEKYEQRAILLETIHNGQTSSSQGST